MNPSFIRRGEEGNQNHTAAEIELPIARTSKQLQRLGMDVFVLMLFHYGQNPSKFREAVRQLLGGVQKDH